MINQDGIQIMLGLYSIRLEILPFCVSSRYIIKSQLSNLMQSIQLLVKAKNGFDLVFFAFNYIYAMNLICMYLCIYVYL